MSESEEQFPHARPDEELKQARAEIERQARIAQEERERRADAEAREAQLREELRRAEARAANSQGSAASGAVYLRLPSAAPASAQPSGPSPARLAWKKPPTIVLIAAVPIVLVLAVLVTPLVASRGGQHASIDATGSPAVFVRDVLAASYSGDAVGACAQFTPAALAQVGGLDRCQSSGSTSASDAAVVQKAHYWPTVAGDRAVVLTSVSDNLLDDRSRVALVKDQGRWKISCVGYCSSGSNP